MGSEYTHMYGHDVYLSEKQENKSSQQWEEVKSDGGWVKLKQPKGGLFLHVSEDGEKLTIEKDSKGMLLFISTSYVLNNHGNVCFIKTDTLYIGGVRFNETDFR